MLKSSAIQYFGSQSKLAKAIGISQGAIAQWGDKVPATWAAVLDKITDGELEFDNEFYGFEKVANEK